MPGADWNRKYFAQKTQASNVAGSSAKSKDEAKIQ
jgi:hypothetical protein